MASLLVGCKSSDDSTVTPGTPGSSSSITAVLSTTTNTNTNCGSTTGLARVVCLAEAFKATLSSSQVATVQLTYSKANAQRWSNLPEGLYRNRVGINLGALSDAQLAAFRNLMTAVLALSPINEGYDEMLGNLVADDYLNTAGGGSTYGAESD